MNNPGAVGCLFALLWLAQNYREILWPLLQTAERLAPLRSAVGLLTGTGRDRGRSIVRGAHVALGGPYAREPDDNAQPRSSGSSVSAPAPAMLPSD